MFVSIYRVWPLFVLQNLPQMPVDTEVVVGMPLGGISLAAGGRLTNSHSLQNPNSVGFSPVLLKFAVFLSLLILAHHIPEDQEGSVGFGGEYHVAHHNSL